MLTISKLLPKFCVELQDLISSCGRSELVDQVPDLPIVGRCVRSDWNCAHIYTTAPPNGQYGAGHSNLILPADEGFVALDWRRSRKSAAYVELHISRVMWSNRLCGVDRQALQTYRQIMLNSRFQTRHNSGSPLAAQNQLQASRASA